MLNGHGDDLHLCDTTITHNFSSNVYYKGCSPLLLEHLKNAMPVIENYPSPIAEELNPLAAQKHQLNPNQFLFANGATEAFYLIAQCYKNKTATIVGPTFSEYEDACKIHQLDYTFINHTQCEATCFNTHLVFLCNPNNPDGKLISFATIEKWLQTAPQSHFVIDEAYVEFSATAATALPLINRYPNITVVRSLTKTFAIPGLRLGYVVSNAHFISKLIALKMPWTVNSLAIKAGIFVFENYETLVFDKVLLLQETQQFKQQLAAIEWLQLIPGTTSYFLMNLKNKKAAHLKEYLIKNYRILIREATNFTGLQGEHIRLAVQSPTANQALIHALKQWS